jgi:hypothetical protein
VSYSPRVMDTQMDTCWPQQHRARYGGAAQATSFHVVNRGACRASVHPDRGTRSPKSARPKLACCGVVLDFMNPKASGCCPAYVLASSVPVTFKREVPPLPLGLVDDLIHS